MQQPAIKKYSNAMGVRETAVGHFATSKKMLSSETKRSRRDSESEHLSIMRMNYLHAKEAGRKENPHKKAHFYLFYFCGKEIPDPLIKTFSSCEKRGLSLISPAACKRLIVCFFQIRKRSFES